MTADQLSTRHTVPTYETPGTDDITVEPDDTERLVRAEDRLRFDRRWRDLQTRFIDDPRQAVESADRLVVDLIDHVADRVAAQRCTLAPQHDGEGPGDTEQLRLTFQRYRALFTRLLSP